MSLRKRLLIPKDLIIKIFLSNTDFTFRKNSSTELATLELIDLLAQLKNHMIPINFYIDLAMAFDSVNHDILLDKLSYYGVNGTAKNTLKELFIR